VSAATDRFSTCREPKFTDGLRSAGTRPYIPILVVHPDIGGLKTRGDVPVDVPDIIVILVFAQVGQIQPESAKERPVVAVQQAVQTADHGPLQAQQDCFRIARRR
jgi:hypothetical protein